MATDSRQVSAERSGERSARARVANHRRGLAARLLGCRSAERAVCLWPHTLESVFESAEGVSRNEREKPSESRRKRFAGLVVGVVAEQEFERRYTELMKGQEFSFADHTKEGTDTDFLTLDSRGRPAIRINIKAHGTFFEKAKTFVGLEPEDTFALATYKVRQAVRKSQHEALPFLFAIVSSAKLRADAVADALPPEVAAIADTSTLYAA